MATRKVDDDDAAAVPTLKGVTVAWVGPSFTAPMPPPPECMTSKVRLGNWPLLPSCNPSSISVARPRYAGALPTPTAAS